MASKVGWALDEEDRGAFERITLKNGQRAIRHTGHGEVMHPVGPWEEANQLYVDQGGLEALLTQPGPPLLLMDVGLGAATNAVAALSRVRQLGTRQRRRLKVVSLEHALDPLRLALDDAEGFPFLQPWVEDARALLNTHQVHSEHFDWMLRLGDIRQTWTTWADGPAELVFFDPFSPATNGPLWSPAALRQLRACCHEGGCSVLTYSASTATRVSFLMADFFVGAGRATGLKGETTVANTQAAGLAQPLGAAWLGRWERSSARAPHGEVWSDDVERAVRGHPQFRAR